MRWRGIAREAVRAVVAAAVAFGVAAEVCGGLRLVVEALLGRAPPGLPPFAW